MLHILSDGGYRTELYIDPILSAVFPFVVFYLYTLLMIVTSKRKLLQGSFFKIAVWSTGIVDIVLYAIQYTGTMTLYPPQTFDEVSVAYITFGLLLVLCMLLHLQNNILSTTCLYMAICLPHKYPRLWSPFRTVLYLLIMATISTATLLPLLYFSLFLGPSYTSYVLGYQTDFLWLLARIVMYLLTPIVLSETLVFYFILEPMMVGRMLYVLKRYTGSPEMKRHYNALIKVVLVDALIFAVHILYALYISSVIVHVQLIPIWLQTTIYYSAVFHAVLYPIRLVLFSREAREEIFRLCRRNQTTVIEIQPSPRI